MDLRSSPNRLVPVSRSRRMSTFHLSLMRVRVVYTGQAGRLGAVDWDVDSLCFSIVMIQIVLQDKVKFLTGSIVCAPYG